MGEYLNETQIIKEGVTLNPIQEQALLLGNPLGLDILQSIETFEIKDTVGFPTGEFRSYLPKPAKMVLFRTAYPRGCVVTKETKISGSFVEAHAYVYADGTDNVPLADAWGQAQIAESELPKEKQVFEAMQMAIGLAKSRALEEAGFGLFTQFGVKSEEFADIDMRSIVEAKKLEVRKEEEKKEEEKPRVAVPMGKGIRMAVTTSESEPTTATAPARGKRSDLQIMLDAISELRSVIEQLPKLKGHPAKETLISHHRDKWEQAQEKAVAKSQKGEAKTYILEHKEEAAILSTSFDSLLIDYDLVERKDSAELFVTEGEQVSLLPEMNMTTALNTIITYDKYEALKGLKLNEVMKNTLLKSTLPTIVGELDGNEKEAVLFLIENDAELLEASKRLGAI